MQTNRQEQQQEQQPIYQAARLPSEATAFAPNPPGSMMQAAAQIDAYLDAVCLQMPADVPTEAIAEMRREMQGHLEAAVIAHCELGQAEAQAVQSALTQFGPPQAVARRWQHEWTETLAETKTLRLWPSFKTALKTWAAADIIAIAICVAFPPLEMAHNMRALQATVISLLMYTALIGLPLLTGIGVGLRARRHPLLCTLGGNLMLLPLLIIGMMGVRRWYICYAQWVTQRHYSAPLAQEFRDAVQSVASFLPTWIIFSLLGCGVVLAGRHIRKRARRRIITR